MVERSFPTPKVGSWIPINFIEHLSTDCNVVKTKIKAWNGPSQKTETVTDTVVARVVES